MTRSGGFGLSPSESGETRLDPIEAPRTDLSARGPNDHFQEDIFGPVLVVLRAETLEDASRIESRAMVFAAIVGAITAGLTAFVCYAYGGGGLAIPGAVPVLVVNAGIVGFLAGLISTVKK